MGAVMFNDNEPYAAAWLRNLHPGAAVDERSISAITALDVDGYERVHLFAGIGGWEYALRLAGWEGPVWTGSCPCQPFSAAGKRKGTDDERHLWPEFLRLIRECRPPTIFGEQVASALGRAWLAGVRADLEALGYAVGAADLCAAGVGAPHQRQRLYWVADAESHGQSRREAAAPVADQDGAQDRLPVGSGGVGAVALTAGGEAVAATTGRLHAEPRGYGADGRLEHAAGDGRLERRAEPGGRRSEPRCGIERLDNPTGARLTSSEREKPDEPEGRRRGLSVGRATGYWDAYDIIPMLDGKARRIEPKYVEMVDGLSGTMDVGSTRQGAEEMNATQAHPRDSALLSPMQEGDGAQTLPNRGTGRSDGLLQAPLLRSDLHGGMDGRSDQGRFSEEQSAAVGQDGSAELRAMWPHVNSFARSPQGSRSPEQREAQLADFVRLLPSSLALAQLHGDTATEKTLLAVLRACGTEGLLQYPPHAVQEAWRSLDGEARQRLWNALSQTRLVRTFEHPLADGIPARVGRLRAYGNAIVPQVAAEFISAFMETR